MKKFNGFTLAEGATHVGIWKKNCKFAFTLAEVLITLGVIGVVAAMTLPALFTNITGYVNTKRQENIGQKVAQAMEQRRAHGLLNTQYATTESFVDEFQKYIKIAKRCDSEHIGECWPTPIVTTGADEEYEVSQAKTGKYLSLESESNNVGLVLADGAPIILNYNPSAPGIDVGDKVKWTEGLPKYTTTVTSAIDFVMDVNGGKGPNSEKEGSKRDIRSFKSAKFSKGGPDCSKYPDSFYVEDIGCVVNIGTNYTPARDYVTMRSTEWYGAKIACIYKGMTLPDLSTLRSLYIKKSEYSDIPQSSFYWSSTEDDNDAYFYAKSFNFGNGTSSRTHKENNSHLPVLCVGN